MIPWDQWNQKLTTGFASGEVGNVIYGQANSGNVQSGYLEPLDDYVTPEILGNWLPGLQAGVTYFGRIYALPTATNPHFTTFSATALEKWGTPELMTDVGTDRGKVTFDMIMEAGKKFGDKATRYFWGVPCDHGSILYWMFGSWLEGWGVKSWDDAEERWQAADSPDAVAAFQWCVDAAAAGVMPPGAMLPKWSDIDNLLWTENLGGRLQWAGMQTELETAQAAGQASKDFKLFYAAFPHKEGLGPFATGMAPIVYTVGKTAKPAVREASFQYANFLSGGDDAAQISWLIEGAFPGTKSGVKATEGHPKLSDPNIKWVLNTLMTQYKPEITGGNWQPVTNARSNKIFFTLDVWNYFVQQFQSLMLGQKTAEEMLKEIATKINTALGATV